MTRCLSDADLGQRVHDLKRLQRPCRLCPRCCGVDRHIRRGFCRQPLDLQVAVVCSHGGEEPPISGSGGAGTVFVAGCTMRCGFCQNHQISQICQATPLPPDWTWSARRLAERLLELQRDGCHNIEWVSPTQHLPGLVESLRLARRDGLTLPVVYNSNGYERPEVLSLLEGVVDVYLPDAKYGDAALARRLSATPEYVSVNRAALLEMRRQVGGPLRLDRSGLARRGLIVRHLVLPGQLDNTRQVLRWITSQLGPDTWLSVMSQYFPAHRAAASPPHPRFAHLGRGLTSREYRRVVDLLDDAALDNGWIQELSTCERFRPDFQHADPFSAPPRPAG